MRIPGKWLLSILGTLLLGALGSGLWSAVFAPLGASAGRALMSLLTLGIRSAKDGIYLRAAQGLSERPSVLLLLFCGVTFLAITIALVVLSMLLPHIARWVKDPPRDPVRTNRRLRRLALGVSLANTFNVTALFVQLLFVSYTNTVVSRFNQQLSVVTPYISPEERVLFTSRFALIRTRSEFVHLFEELNTIAVRNGKPRSDFSPW